jgi:hypothetical protein
MGFRRMPITNHIARDPATKNFSFLMLLAYPIRFQIEIFYDDKKN